MQCVILAGGLGTRMRAWTERVPKALIPIAGRPFADYQLTWLAQQGVTQVVYSVGYKGALIRSYVNSGEAWGLPVVYVDEGDKLLGTGGALRLAAEQGILDEAFLVLYGDSFLPINFTEVWTRFQKRNQPAMMTVLRNEGHWDTSNVIYSDNQVVVYDKSCLHPRRAEMRFIDYGLSAFRRSVICDLIPLDEKTDLASIFTLLSEQGKLAGDEVTERFYEIGSVPGLLDFTRFIQTSSLWLDGCSSAADSMRDTT
jgi:NDP-sugar pyrophosphorylase family protein